jgi:hypothetical protein
MPTCFYACPVRMKIELRLHSRRGSIIDHVLKARASGMLKFALKIFAISCVSSLSFLHFSIEQILLRLQIMQES